ncbi:MAG: DUF4116 domain-containing protein [Parachlamydiaceae bacterium]|nr:DUF4116 domain-containing protein [Parachlamydiaceae bacterium]
MSASSSAFLSMSLGSSSQNFPGQAESFFQQQFFPDDLEVLEEKAFSQNSFAFSSEDDSMVNSRSAKKRRITPQVSQNKVSTVMWSMFHKFTDLPQQLVINQFIFFFKAKELARLSQCSKTMLSIVKAKAKQDIGAFFTKLTPHFSKKRMDQFRVKIKALETFIEKDKQKNKLLPKDQIAQITFKARTLLFVETTHKRSIILTNEIYQLLLNSYREEDQLQSISSIVYLFFNLGNPQIAFGELFISRSSDFTLKDVLGDLKNDEEVVKKAVEIHGAKQLTYTSKALLTKKPFVLELIKIKADCMEFIPQELMNNEEFTLQMIKENEAVFKYLNKNLTENRVFCLKAVRANGLVFKYLKLFKDDQMFEEAFKQNFEVIRFYPVGLKNDKFLFDKIKADRRVLLHIEQNKNSVIQGIVYYYNKELEKKLPLDVMLQNFKNLGIKISKGCKSSKSFIDSLSEHFPYPFLFADDSVKYDLEFVSSVIEKRPEAIATYKFFKENCKFVLSLCKLNPKIYPFMHEDFKKEFPKFILQIDGLLLKELPPSIGQNKENVIVACKQNGLALEFASDQLKSDLDCIKAALQQNKNAFKFVHQDIVNNRSFLIALMKECEISLSLLPLKYRADQEVVGLAIRRNWKELEFASIELRNNKELMLFALKINNESIQFIGESLKENEDFFLSVIKINPQLLKHASPKLLENHDFLLKVIKIDLSVLKISPTLKLLVCPDFYAKAVKICGRILQFVPGFFRSKITLRMYLDAIDNDPYSFEYFPDTLKQDKKLVMQIIKKNYQVLQYASITVRNDPEFMLEAFKVNIQTLLYASPELKNNKEYFLKIVKQDGVALKYAGNALKKDVDVAFAAIQQNLKASKYVKAEKG